MAMRGCLVSSQPRLPAGAITANTATYRKASHNGCKQILSEKSEKRAQTTQTGGGDLGLAFYCGDFETAVLAKFSRFFPGPPE